jgi:hypothetical protein
LVVKAVQRMTTDTRADPAFTWQCCTSSRTWAWLCWAVKAAVYKALQAAPPLSFLGRKALPYRPPPHAQSPPPRACGPHTPSPSAAAPLLLSGASCVSRGRAGRLAFRAFAAAARRCRPFLTRLLITPPPRAATHQPPENRAPSSPQEQRTRLGCVCVKGGGLSKGVAFLTKNKRRRPWRENEVEESKE